MANFSTYLSNKLLDHANGKTAYTMPTVYVGVSTTTPTMPAGTGVTEPTVGTGNYARVNTNSPMVWGAAASNNATNSANAIIFGTSSAAWSSGASNCTYLVAYDAATGGNLLWVDPIATPFAVNAAGIAPSAATSQVTNSIT